MGFSAATLEAGAVFFMIGEGRDIETGSAPEHLVRLAPLSNGSI